MSKIFLSDGPCKDEFLVRLKNFFPEIESYSFYSYLTVRKVSSDLENALESYFSAHGISSGRFMLLMLLSTGKGMMPSELAQQSGVTQATISGLLNGLEKMHLIIRETHNHDGRAFVIRLSEAGQALIDKLKPQFLQCISEIMANFNQQEQRSLVDLLSRFNDCLGKLKEPVPAGPSSST